MNEDYEVKATRLLDIIDTIVWDDAFLLEPQLPFQVDEDGKVIFFEKLAVELAKPENNDLLDWAHEHIVSLFE
ncbi:hypothetical protein [Polynucleobacter kasalickyi]|uniref:Uncharacterized protein n=1 Tax=Polynucleobacter kasalickyi TaxID=1938817 RepID=A0A1W2AK26_9BURK|nr:hypothetical protein [Polynucleobacter kasalickyi]SMC61017.1 hypothetical protein SAMN06296008_10922 [Polynucleobacter kasalickyi]